MATATSEPRTPPPPPSLRNFCAALSESKRIIDAHSRHFLALSVLFLLPISFSVVVYPTIQHQLLNGDNSLHNSKTSLSKTPQITFTAKFIVLVLLYSVFMFVFSLFAVGSITYSVYHGFYGRPVKLKSAIKSSMSSFLPLLATTLACQFIFYGIFIVFSFFLFAVVKGIQFLGIHISYSSLYFVALCMPIIIVLFLVTAYLQVNWCLVSVVVVVESIWGCRPLKRSNALIKGMKNVALSSLSFFGFSGLVLGWANMVWDPKFGGVITVVGEWKNWGVIVQIVAASTLFVLLMLYSLAVNTVLYMYCKAIHGELAMEIAEEFAREYVSLPVDDDGQKPPVGSAAYT
ncbi:hypothetical protein ACFE04_024644 [Oxalis oulophora]